MLQQPGCPPLTSDHAGAPLSEEGLLLRARGLSARAGDAAAPMRPPPPPDASTPAAEAAPASELPAPPARARLPPLPVPACAAAGDAATSATSAGMGSGGPRAMSSHIARVAAMRSRVLERLGAIATSSSKRWRTTKSMKPACGEGRGRGVKRSGGPPDSCERKEGRVLQGVKGRAAGARRLPSSPW